jgi:hypothetical protein
MKTRLFLACSCLFLAAAASTQATIYTDPIGDGALVGTGGGILDITSVEVNNTASDLIFKISLAGDPVATDWGKYMIAIDSVAGGDSVGNGWGRPISMAGMDYWAGSWVDSGNGVQFFSYSGSWSQIGGAGPFAGGPAVPGLSISKDATSVTITTPLSLLGLSAGNSFLFDVYTSGGGGTDSAIDALANPSQSVGNWGDFYSTQSPLSYTIAQVPEPAVASLLCLAGLMAARFRHRK